MISDFPDADGLTGKDLAEVDLTSTEAQSTALRDDDGEIVEGIFDRRQAAVGASDGGAFRGGPYGAWVMLTLRDKQLERELR